MVGLGEGEKASECVSSLSFLKLLSAVINNLNPADPCFLDEFASFKKEARIKGERAHNSVLVILRCMEDFDGFWANAQRVECNGITRLQHLSHSSFAILL